MSKEAENKIKEAADKLKPYFVSPESLDELKTSVEGVTTKMDETKEALTAAMDEKLAEKLPNMEELETKLDEIGKQVADFPTIISEARKKQNKSGKETSLGKILFCQYYKREQGVWPSGANYTAEVDFLGKAVKHALDTGTATSGAELVPDEWRDEIIEELGASAVVLQAGPTIIPMSGDVMHLAGFDADATAEWLGEGAASTEDTPTTREVTLNLSTARLLSHVSIEFIQDALPATDAALRANLTRTLSRFVDDGLLQGSGANRPTGLRDIVGISSIGADNDNADGGEINYDDFSRAVLELDTNDVSPDGRVWFMHPRTFDKVRRIKDLEGRPLFIQDFNNTANVGNVFGYPIMQSSQILTNETKGGGTSLSYILLARMPGVFVGQGVQQRGISLAISEHARFANAQVAIRLLARTDINVDHPESIVLIDGVV